MMAEGKHEAENIEDRSSTSHAPVQEAGGSASHSSARQSNGTCNEATTADSDSQNGPLWAAGNDHAASSSDVSMGKLAAISCIAAGVQFGWAIQLSLLTPYVQTLGIPHAWASFIWLCGPISGLIVQPVVGVWSDRCRHPLGRRRPYIIGGAILIILAVLLISYASEIGFLLGDNIDATSNSFRPAACIVFVLGFWCLDLSNNTVQGPSRALLADLTTAEQCNAANSFYSFWVAIGSVLGYSAGAIGSWYKWFPLLTSTACTAPCANLKAAFFLHVGFLSVCTAITCIAAKEKTLDEVQREAAASAGIELQAAQNGWETTERSRPLNGHPANQDTRTVIVTEPREGMASAPLEGIDIGPVRSQLSAPVEGAAGKGVSLARVWRAAERRVQALGARDGEDIILRTGAGSISSTYSEAEIREDSGSVGHANSSHGKEGGMLQTLNQMPTMMHVVLAITAMSWLAWFPFLLFDTDWMGREVFHGDPGSMDAAVAEQYQSGVREGALGLLLFAIVQGITSTRLDPWCMQFGPGAVWGSANVIAAVSMLAVCILSGVAAYSPPGASWLSASALVIFAVLGAPFATTMVVPFTLAAQCCAEAGIGVGLAMGILNLAIVIPQIIVSLLAGPVDSLLGGGNVPAFASACMFASFAAVGAFQLLPRDLRSTNSIDPFSLPHV